MGSFLLIFASLGLGYVLNKQGVFDKKSADTLNRFVIYISLPAMVLYQVPKLELSSDILLPALMPWGVMALSAGAVLLLSRIYGWSSSLTGALLLVAVLGNTSFLGIPLVSSYYGQEALGYVMVYDQFGTFLALAVYGGIVVSVYAKAPKTGIKQMARKILLFPPFLSLLVALLCIGREFPAPLLQMLQHLSMTIVPLALVAVGIQLRFKLPRIYLPVFSAALAIKLVLAPMAAYLFVLGLGQFSLAAKVTVMEAAMGPMITAAAVATNAGLAPRLSVAIVGYGTMFALITTGLWYLLLP
ncbi:MAG: AEC family transporter [Campylobacterota bacterium]